MKRFLLFMLMGTGFAAHAQMGSRSIIPFHENSSMPERISAPDTVETHSAELLDISDIPTFGIYGIGNTNTETFNNLNASGKLSGYIRPYKHNGKRPFYVEVGFAFNINASNTDSLLANSLLFPDVGQNSFSGNVTFNWIVYKKGPDNLYLVTPFFEFANKTIKGRRADTARRFYTLNSSLGVNLQYLFLSEGNQVSFTFSPYWAVVSVPDPGTKDYRYLLTGDEDANMKSTLNSWGIKVAFQYNFFQIFADFRTVTGAQENFPVEGIRGFHPNIGIVFNTQIFEK